MLIASSTLYHIGGYSWKWFAILFFVPDLSMFGYAINRQFGAMIYNLAHTYSLVGLLAAIGFFSGASVYYSLALVWFAHIGFDRALGYGLKYPTSFRDTHISRS